ncbi:MAG: helicase HerA-like domain-containing protein, partial [Candidatus Pacearchaeota archaeon]
MSIKIAKKEWRKERFEKSVHYFLLSLFLVTLLLFLLLATLYLFEITGYSTYLSSRAGYVTKVTLYTSKSVDVWAGIYGLALRVPGFTQRLYKDVPSGTIVRSDIFFDCIQHDAKGGPEIYASTNPNLNLMTSDVSPATIKMVDDFINCSGKEYCANNTFTRNISIFLGDTEIKDIPSTYTYKYTGENEVFSVGVLNVSNSLVFVAKINSSIQPGYNPDYLVNYQMLLPTPPNTSQRYYFFSDPNDVCPAGGLGISIDAIIYGHVLDLSNNPLENVKVSVAGYSNISNNQGFYNISASVLPGTYSIVAQKEGFNPYFGNITINSSNFIIENNITLLPQTLYTSSNSINLLIFGRVVNTAGTPISGTNVSFGNSSGISNNDGNYSFFTTAIKGKSPIIAIKADYDNFVDFIEVSDENYSINYDIILKPANLNVYVNGPYPTGPYTEQKQYDIIAEEKEKIEDTGKDYWISTIEINKQVRENTFIEDKITLYNFKKSNLNVFFTLSSELTDIIKLDKNTLSIPPNNFDHVILTISGIKPVGVYRGNIKITGDIEAEIPVRIEIIPKRFLVDALIMEIDLFKSNINLGSKLRYKLNIQNLLSEQNYKILLKHFILSPNGTKIYVEEREEVEIKNFLSLIKEIDTSNLSEGDYLLEVEANYFDRYSLVSSPFKISRPIHLYTFFGIPLWLLFLIISIFSFLVLNLFLYSRHLKKKKRYHLALKLETLPKPGERSIKIGKIAETNIPAYFNLDDLTTHAIIAGATGGGKSIAAQVFIEEALDKGIAVIVFDPTAQWSGMLRKCEDKKMLSFYPKFGLKPSDARAFPGNVSQIKN